MRQGLQCFLTDIESVYKDTHFHTNILAKQSQCTQKVGGNFILKSINRIMNDNNLRVDVLSGSSWICKLVFLV